MWCITIANKEFSIVISPTEAPQDAFVNRRKEGHVVDANTFSCTSQNSVKQSDHQQVLQSRIIMKGVYTGKNIDTNSDEAQLTALKIRHNMLIAIRITSISSSIDFSITVWPDNHHATHASTIKQPLTVSKIQPKIQVNVNNKGHSPTNLTLSEALNKHMPISWYRKIHKYQFYSANCIIAFANLQFTNKLITFAL